MAHIFKLEWKNPAQGRDAPEAPAHRDDGDTGRYQIVEALSDVAFDVWPGSHKLFVRRNEFVNGHFHMSAYFKHILRKNCPQVIFAAAPGDVLIFEGGQLFHGSPPVTAEQPSPRVVTYANFWPPGSDKGHKKGLKHLPKEYGMQTSLVPLATDAEIARREQARRKYGIPLGSDDDYKNEAERIAATKLTYDIDTIEEQMEIGEHSDFMDSLRKAREILAHTEARMKGEGARAMPHPTG